MESLKDVEILRVLRGLQLLGVLRLVFMEDLQVLGVLQNLTLWMALARIRHLNRSVVGSGF